MKIILVGASNPEVKRLIIAIQKYRQDFEVLGFIDNDQDKKGKEFVGFPVFGGFEILDRFREPDTYFVNLITRDSLTRFETSKFLANSGCQFTNLIHPSVDLTMVEIGVGNYIQEGCILQAGVRIGNNSSTGALVHVGHESTIGNSVFLAHGCCISGLVHIEDGVFMGTNATVLPRLTIGRWATIGAGAVIIDDVPDYATVVGNPAKIIHFNKNIYENADIFGKNPV